MGLMLTMAACVNVTNQITSRLRWTGKKRPPLKQFNFLNYHSLKKVASWAEPLTYVLISPQALLTVVPTVEVVVLSCFLQDQRLLELNSTKT
jgi:hypothetical protein